MKVLMIEDNVSTIQGLIDAICDREWKYIVSSFDAAEERIYAFDPDVVVMDWMFDEEDAEAGRPILERIVANEFRPVIVFSAHDLSTVLEDILLKHRLIDFTRKGDDDSKLAEKIDTWRDSALALSRMRHSMNEALIESAKVLDVFQKMTAFPSPEIVSFMLSRRTIQYFEQAEVGEQPPTWIQYVYPPMMNNLLVADVLRIYSEEADQSQPGIPSEYCVVLTPSCDMVNHAEHGFKVLVSHCCNKGRFTEQRLADGQSIDSSKGKEKVARVVKELQYGYNKAFVALPELPHVLPYMTLDLKDLDFVIQAEIAPTLEAFDKEKHRYYRVASVASPFREQVVWAHMINSCRPGMPVRDTIDWAKGILIPWMRLTFFAAAAE